MSTYQDIHWDKIFRAIGSDAPTADDVRSVWLSVWPFVQMPPVRTINAAIAKFEEGFYAVEDKAVADAPAAPAVVREDAPQRLFEEPSSSSEEVLSKNALANIWPKKYIAECLAEILHEMAASEEFQKAGPHGVALSKILRDRIDDSASLMMSQVAQMIKDSEARTAARILASEARIVEAMAVIMGAPEEVKAKLQLEAPTQALVPVVAPVEPVAKAKRVIIYGAMQEQAVVIERNLAKVPGIPKFKVEFISDRVTGMPSIPTGDVAVVFQKFSGSTVAKKITARVNGKVGYVAGIQDAVSTLESLLKGPSQGSTKVA